MTEQSTAVAVQKDSTLILSVDAVVARLKSLQNLMKRVMVRNEDFGVIPGTDKPTLLKPGAEKICLMLGLTPQFERNLRWDGEHLTVQSDCTLTDRGGVVIARAGAICTTRETKYAYRQSTRRCPHCNAAAIIKGKAEYGGGWLCFKKKDGCGAKFDDKDPVITGQSGEREENQNIADTYNTVQKIADKRAYVGATLFGTAASHIYSQDIEDFPTDDSGPAQATQPAAPTSYPSPTNEADTLLPAELDMHISEMEKAFERGEGGEWWTANRKEILARCTQEQRKRFTDRKDELKGAGASSEAMGESPPSSVSSGDASKPRGRPKKQAEPSGKADSIVAEGANQSEALLSLRQKMGAHHANTGTTQGFYDDNFNELDRLPDQDKAWLDGEADALEGKE